MNKAKLFLKAHFILHYEGANYMASYGIKLRTSRHSCQLWCDWTLQVCSTVTSLPSCFNHWALVKEVPIPGITVTEKKILSSTFSWAFSVKHYYIVIISSLLELLSTFCTSNRDHVSIHDSMNLCCSTTWFSITSKCFCISIAYILGLRCLLNSV